ncbi:MAG: T9SS C-terminal target domain-containing protein [Bacteroidota bacterium]|nr:T9SS C-terminal target domain-containing protein [Bacteroidota bacterium]
MKYILFVFLLLTLPFEGLFSQLRDFRIHQRGMLHQTVFNTGEVGRTFDNGTAGMLVGYPSMEWPPNSSMIIDRTKYAGQHNSFGGGLYIGGTRGTVRQYIYCGAVTDATGKATQVENIYSYPISIERIENYPVLATGILNPAYNPDEAEEIIVAKWGTPLGITVTRTSRAWSYPGYDSFIIYEYELHNTTPDTVKDTFIGWGYGFMTSMFGYERRFNRWAEADSRSRDQFARFDLKRYMTYNHDRTGNPDTTFFNLWSKPGNRGGLNSPQAAGIMMLYYDYQNLALRGQTSTYVSPSDTALVWDANRKMKQPWLNRYENANLYPTKLQTWLDPLSRKSSVFKGANDSINFSADNFHWIGRAKPSQTLGWSQPAGHGYGFGPYTLPPNSVSRFVVAEVVGYGPGVASDSVYRDLGGGIRGEPDPYLQKIPSWCKTLTYPNVGNPPYIGSNYLQTNPLPWYVTPGVVSIRDVADRAIQMYTGRPLAKYDTSQYEPMNSRPNGFGAYNTIKIPFPAPMIKIENTRAAVNKIIWGPQVEEFTTPKLNAPFAYYKAMRATHPLGPWTLIDSVGKRDPRYFHDSVYVVLDRESNIGEFVYYAVFSVDSLGGKGGMTNFTKWETQAPAVVGTLGKVYVVPNPLIVTSGLGGSDPDGEVTDKVQFMGLTKRCTIRIFSYSGQLINTIEHNRDTYGNPWYQISRNNQILASGVYFFVVEDESGAHSRGKFVIIH